MFNKKVQTKNIIKKEMKKGEMTFDFGFNSDSKIDMNDMKDLFLEGIAILDEQLEKFKKK